MHDETSPIILTAVRIRDRITSLDHIEAYAMACRSSHHGTMRTVLLAALLPTAVGCSAAGTAAVRTTGPADQTKLVLNYIRSAERGDAARFSTMTGRSADATISLPEMAEVDRTDEGCVLASLDANTRMVSAVWTCRDNDRQNVQRTFLIEAGRITHMWNDWAEQPLVLRPEGKASPAPVNPGDPS